MLSVRGVTKTFGGVTALDDLSFDIVPGEIVGLIGPNGSGKTTCINTISGLYTPTSGTVWLDGESLSGTAPHRVVRRGIGRTFQNLRLLRDLSVLDNVRVGQNSRIRTAATWFGLSGPAFEQGLSAEAAGLLEAVGLNARASDLAGSLSYGQQKRLEIARALATKPRYLLLDEPAGGMNANDVEDLKKVMLTMKGNGVGLLLVEHNMGFVMDICDRLVVLNFGRKLAQGSPREIRANPQVIDAYLGHG